jgi:hypothetical protein
MGRHSEDYTNKTFGRLHVNKFIGSQNNRRIWECQCSCGTKIEVNTSELTRGLQSCGCLWKDTVTTHDKSLTRTYKIWLGIKCRCFSINHHSYQRYGAKGITLHEKWINDYSAFLDYIGECPTDKHSIDR